MNGQQGWLLEGMASEAGRVEERADGLHEGDAFAIPIPFSTSDSQVHKPPLAYELSMVQSYIFFTSSRYDLFISKLFIFSFPLELFLFSFPLELFIF